MQKVNITEHFLELFNHRIFTFAYLNSKGMRSFPCTHEKLSSALLYLHKENKKGNEIYFMVNQGNGVLNEAKTACHSTNNVISLSALFLDAELPDNKDPFPAIKAFYQNSFVPPSVVIETSPNRYHCYWLLEETPLDKQSIVQWKQLQAFLHSKLSSDRTMTDIPQILRLPGYHNVKKDCEVTCKTVSNIRYKLSDLYSQIERQFPDLKTFKAFEPLHTLTEEYQVPEGERHEEILRRARKLYNIDTFTDEDVKCYIHGFISNHVKEPKNFLPGGKRYDEINRILSAAKSYADDARQKELAIKIEKVASKKVQNPFQLDPEFFYQAPGLVGEITRHIVDTSNFPIPAHAFAAATSIVGLTKARYIQGPRKLPPLNYFLCLAPSGSGKTTIQHVLKNTLAKIQLRHLIEDGIASAQGLISFLSKHNLGLVIYDEVKDLFQTIQSKNSYEMKISTELTKLYTAYGSSYTPPTTKTEKTKVTLEKPLFSFVGYGHFSLVETLFTKANVLEGLIPRFIILNVDDRTIKNSTPKPLSDTILDKLRFYVTRSCLIVEEKAKDSKLDVNVRPSIKVVSFSDEAQNTLNAFDSEVNSLYADSVSARNGLEALFSRGTEQVYRLSEAMSDTTVIDSNTVEFATTLVKAQLQAFYQSFDKVINHSENSKQTDTLLDTIADLCSKTPDYSISKRDLQRKIQHRYKDIRLFKQHFDALLDMERVTLFTKNKNGKAIPFIRLGDIEP